MEKNSDKSKGSSGMFVVTTDDHEYMFLCPNLKASSLYYRLKLVIHNRTSYDKVSCDILNIAWDKTEGQLNVS